MRGSWDGPGDCEMLSLQGSRGASWARMHSWQWGLPVLPLHDRPGKQS